MDTERRDKETEALQKEIERLWLQVDALERIKGTEGLNEILIEHLKILKDRVAKLCKFY